MITSNKHDADDAFLADAFFRALPSAGSYLARFGRAVILFVIALALARITPWTAGSAWTLALAVGLLSICTLTKWVAASGIAVLLILAIVPPPIIANLGRL